MKLEEINGIILIDKPTNKTSHQIVQIVKRKLGIKKAGHAGTLDPLATGLLIVLVNKATKLSNNFLNQDKSYLVEVQLFIETDTGDVSGKIIKNQTPFKINLEELKKTLDDFNNFSYYQIPPLYSAIKIKGKKMYEYARKGIKIEPNPRLIEIKKIELIGYNSNIGKIEFFTECSKGTYIRSLAKDIANKLGTIAAVSNLRRISSGNFHVNQSITLEKLSLNDILII